MTRFYIERGIMMEQNKQSTDLKSNGLGIASMILGIIGFLLSVVYIGGLIGFVGLILGIVGISMKNAKKGFAIAGIVLCTLSIMIVFGMTATNDTTNRNTESTKDNVIKNENNDNKDSSKGNIDNFYVEIKESKIVKDSEKDILLVKISFTNNSNTEESFDYNLDSMAYQNGVELDTPWTSYGIEELDWSNKGKKIKPGITFEFNVGFYLNDKESNVEVNVRSTVYSIKGKAGGITKIIKIKE